jgi:hypothetical protein
LGFGCERNEQNALTDIFEVHEIVMWRFCFVIVFREVGEISKLKIQVIENRLNYCKGLDT